MQETVVDSAEARTIRRGNTQTSPARKQTMTAAKWEKQMAVPITSATITVLYSISFPVLNVLSQ